MTAPLPHSASQTRAAPGGTGDHHGAPLLPCAPAARKPAGSPRSPARPSNAGARAIRKGAALDNVAAHLKALPDQPDGIALAAQATQEGHWRFVNKAGETFTAGTPDELKRVASVLLPDAKADAKLSLYVTQDTVFQHRAALKELPKSTELFVVIGDESYRILRRADGASRAAVRAGAAEPVHRAGRARDASTRRCGS